MKAKIAATILVILMLLYSVTAPAFFNDAYLMERYIPSLTNIGLFSVAAALLFFIRDPLSRMFCTAWTYWCVVGNLFIIGQYFQDKLIGSLFVQYPNNLFCLGMIAFTLGVLLYQVSHQSHSIKVLPDERLPKPADRTKLDYPLVFLCLMLFPLAFAASLFLSGAPTILSGENIVDQMYETDHGPLYAFRVILPVSVLALIVAYPRLSPTWRICGIAYGSALLFLCIIDGKRDMALLAVIAVAAHSLIRTRGKIPIKNIILLICSLLMYGIISDIRGGTYDETKFDLLRIATIAGVEYKDFAYSITYMPADYLESHGYDWVKSSLASILNRNILAAFGVEKELWVEMDSARSWMRAYGIELGIRTGILSELYYAFGFAMVPAMAAIGYAIGSLSRLTRNSVGKLSYIFLLVAYANLFMAIVGQTSNVLGSLMTLLYVFLFLCAINMISVRAANQLRASLRVVR